MIYNYKEIKEKYKTNYKINKVSNWNLKTKRITKFEVSK